MRFRLWGQLSIALVMAVVVSSCSPESGTIDNQHNGQIVTEDEPQLLQVFNRASEAAEQEDWIAARDACLTGLDLDPNVPALQLFAARTEARLGNEAACRTHLEAALRLGATSTRCPSCASRTRAASLDTSKCSQTSEMRLDPSQDLTSTSPPSGFSARVS